VHRLGADPMPLVHFGAPDDPLVFNGSSLRRVKVTGTPAGIVTASGANRE
jgi:hypothetical protein